MILVIAAMEVEYQALLDLLDDDQEKEIFGVKHHLGKIDDKEIILMLSGIGKVNASSNITSILNEYFIDYIINIGSAGGVVNDYQVKQLDIVVAKQVCQHDVDLIAADRPLGQLPDLPIYYQASINDDMMQALTKTGLEYHYATIASGDTFVATMDKVNYITNHFDDVCAVEMEAGAIAQIAYLRKIPFVVFRSISDVVGHQQSNQLQFEQYIEKASQNSALAAHAIIKVL
jgi:adenosylhomocysteine nucleosidase